MGFMIAPPHGRERETQGSFALGAYREKILATLRRVTYATIDNDGAPWWTSHLGLRKPRDVGHNCSVPHFDKALREA